MSQELARVRIGNVETTVGRARAETKGYDVLDEPTTDRDGSPKGVTRKGGRRRKPRTSVAEAAASKKSQQAAVDSAPSNKENDR